MDWTYRSSIMAVVDGPPLANHLIVGRVAGVGVSALEPRLVRADEVYHVDTRLAVALGGEVLVVGGGGDVVSKADAVVGIPEMHVDQTLISTVEGDASLSHSGHSIEIAHVGFQGHDTGVE